MSRVSGPELRSVERSHGNHKCWGLGAAHKAAPTCAQRAEGLCPTRLIALLCRKFQLLRRHPWEAGRYPSWDSHRGLTLVYWKRGRCTEEPAVTFRNWSSS